MCIRHIKWENVTISVGQTRKTKTQRKRRTQRKQLKRERRHRHRAPIGHNTLPNMCDCRFCKASSTLIFTPSNLGKAVVQRHDNICDTCIERKTETLLSQNSKRRYPSATSCRMVFQPHIVSVQNAHCSYFDLRVMARVVNGCQLPTANCQLDGEHCCATRLILCAPNLFDCQSI